MERTKRSGVWWWALVTLFTLGLARVASAIYLDDDQHVSLRARIYSQAAIRTEGSYGNTSPSVKAGQLVQHRNFFNPELEAKLGTYTGWMKNIRGLSLLAPDALDFRLAGWGFYDGIYDYGTQQFDHQRSAVITRFSKANRLTDVVQGKDDELNARDVYSNQHRVNELYLSYTKGPLFVRLGRQAISWGESDTIAILDQNNPFDLTLGVPGVFEDLDEARIPLWTLRASYSVFDTLGPLSSGLVEAYWVPGDLDTTTATVPLLTLSPYSPPQEDPALTIKKLKGIKINFQEFVLVDHVPESTMDNSRYGVRVQAVVARDYTVSAWFYTHFPNAPVPRMVGLVKSSTLGKNVFMIETVHHLVPVFGLSNTFFFQPLNGIIRMEAEYFNREPSFISGNAGNLPTDAAFILQCKGKPCKPDQFPSGGRVPYASYLRWELGYDRFFFLRALNPTNSFIWINAIVGSYNMDETRLKDFRYSGILKPGGTGNDPDDYVQQQKVEAFMQTHLQTDYMHGKLAPQVTVVVNRLGAWLVPVQVTYRWSDSLLFGVSYTAIGGAFTGAGFFRDRDQMMVRATYQLN